MLFPSSGLHEQWPPLGTHYVALRFYIPVPHMGSPSIVPFIKGADSNASGSFWSNRHTQRLPRSTKSFVLQSPNAVGKLCTRPLCRQIKVTRVEKLEVSATLPHDRMLQALNARVKPEDETGKSVWYCALQCGPVVETLNRPLLTFQFLMPLSGVVYRKGKGVHC